MTKGTTERTQPNARLPRPPSAELMDLVGTLRRSVRRIVRQDWPHRPLTESEVEVLRLLRGRPGLRVREAAAALSLAPNTMSTLVGRLVEQDLLERRDDERDGRAARLYLSAAAARRIAAWRDRRQHVIERAMERLSEPDREVIVRALPALGRLAREVETS